MMEIKEVISKSLFVIGAPVHIELIKDPIVGKPLVGNVIGPNGEKVAFKLSKVTNMSTVGGNTFIDTKQDTFRLQARVTDNGNPGFTGLKRAPTNPKVR